MLGAVYLLYRAALELFDRDIAIIAAVLFCLHPITVFASIDVRPYAFAALAINAAILALVRLRHNHSYWLAALFGFSTACVVYFHFLFAVIFPALALGFFAIKSGNRKNLWRQFGVALAAFAFAFLPVIPWMRPMVHTSGTHVIIDTAPKLVELVWTLAPGWLPLIVLCAVLVAALTRRLAPRSYFQGWRVVLCASLGLIPILILYGVSVETSLHVFVRPISAGGGSGNRALLGIGCEPDQFPRDSIAVLRGTGRDDRLPECQFTLCQDPRLHLEICPGACGKERLNQRRSGGNLQRLR